jgi:hypothetical protein
MSRPVNEEFVAFTSSDVGAAAVAGNAWVTLDFGNISDVLPGAENRKKNVLHRVHVLRKTGASGTAHIALVADVTGSLAAAWATKYESASVAAATRLNETGIDEPMYTDALGNLYFTPGGDATDTFDYEVWFRKVL